MLRLKIKLASPDLQDEFFHIALTFQRKKMELSDLAG
jgi:hypothetical protein